MSGDTKVLISPEIFSRLISYAASPESGGQKLRRIAVTGILFFPSDDKHTRMQTTGFDAMLRKLARKRAAKRDWVLFRQTHRLRLVNVMPSAASHGTGQARAPPDTDKVRQPDELEVSRSFLHLFKQM